MDFPPGRPFLPPIAVRVRVMVRVRVRVRVSMHSVATSLRI